MAAVPSLSEKLATTSTKEIQSSGDSHPAVSSHVETLVKEVLAWQRRIHNRGQIPNKYSLDAEESNLGNRFGKLLYRRLKAVGKERSRSQLLPSEVALVNSVPGVQRVAAPPLHVCSGIATKRRKLRPAACGQAKRRAITDVPAKAGAMAAMRNPLVQAAESSTGDGSGNGSGGVHSTAVDSGGGKAYDPDVAERHTSTTINSGGVYGGGKAYENDD